MILGYDLITRLSAFGECSLLDEYIVIHSSSLCIRIISTVESWLSETSDYHKQVKKWKYLLFETRPLKTS